jgi:hypothetical protein
MLQLLHPLPLLTPPLHLSLKMLHQPLILQLLHPLVLLTLLLALLLNTLHLPHMLQLLQLLQSSQPVTHNNMQLLQQLLLNRLSFVQLPFLQQQQLLHQYLVTQQAPLPHRHNQLVVQQ